MKYKILVADADGDQCDQMLEQNGPMFFKCCPKIALAVLTLQGHLSKQPKESRIIWATFLTNFFAFNFLKSPNLVTLMVIARAGKQKMRSARKQIYNCKTTVASCTNDGSPRDNTYGDILNLYLALIGKVENKLRC